MANCCEKKCLLIGPDIISVTHPESTKMDFYVSKHCGLFLLVQVSLYMTWNPMVCLSSGYRNNWDITNNTLGYCAKVARVGGAVYSDEVIFQMFGVDFFTFILTRQGFGDSDEWRKGLRAVSPSDIWGCVMLSPFLAVCQAPMKECYDTLSNFFN